MSWKWEMNMTLMIPPPAAPSTGKALAAASSETITPNRAAHRPDRRAMAGALSRTTPLRAKYDAASLSAWLMVARAAQ